MACSSLHGSRKKLSPGHKVAVREKLGVPLCDPRTVLLTPRGRALRTQSTHSQSSCVWDTQSHLHVSMSRICCKGPGDIHDLCLLEISARRLKSSIKQHQESLGQCWPHCDFARPRIVLGAAYTHFPGSSLFFAHWPRSNGTCPHGLSTPGLGCGAWTWTPWGNTL